MAYEIFSLRLKPEVKKFIEDQAHIHRMSINKTINAILAAWYESGGNLEEMEAIISRIAKKESENSIKSE